MISGADLLRLISGGYAKNRRTYPRVTVILYSSGMVGKVGHRGRADKVVSTMSLAEGTDERPVTRWDAIREEYEQRLFLPAMICKRHGITPAQLRYRRQVEGWPSIRARVVRQEDLVARMLKVLDKQVRRLETAVDEPIDKQANVLSIQVKTLDKLLEMGAAKRNVEPPTKKDVTDLRNKLAKRIEQFRNR